MSAYPTPIGRLHGFLLLGSSPSVGPTATRTATESGTSIVTPSVVARAVEREADVWVDTDGWEQASKLVTLEEDRQVVRFDGDACAHAFLDLVERYL